MDLGTPIADRDLRSLLGKAIDGGKPRRNLRTLRFQISPRHVYFCCEPSDQRVLCSKFKLPVAIGERLLSLLVMSNIARYRRYTNHASMRVPDRRYGERNAHQHAVLAHASRLEMLYAFAEGDALENIGFLIL